MRKSGAKHISPLGILLASFLAAMFSISASSDDYLGERTESMVAQRPSAVAGKKLPPVAIGTLPSKGVHLVRPREEVVEQWLRKAGDITAQSSPEQIQVAKEDYYRKLAKKTRVWNSPKVQERALQREKELVRMVERQAVQPVTATVFALAVDFGGTDTLVVWVSDGNGCTTQCVTTSGPLKGQIPQPGARDNNTVWYELFQIADAKFYEKLIFGYEGVGRIRMDLTDPRDGLAGIDLTSCASIFPLTKAVRLL